MLTLSIEEIRSFTGCARRSDQEAWLLSHGVPFRKDGERILIARANADQFPQKKAMGFRKQRHHKQKKPAPKGRLFVGDCSRQPQRTPALRRAIDRISSIGRGSISMIGGDSSALAAWNI